MFRFVGCNSLKAIPTFSNQLFANVNSIGLKFENDVHFTEINIDITTMNRTTLNHEKKAQSRRQKTALLKHELQSAVTLHFVTSSCETKIFFLLTFIKKKR